MAGKTKADFFDYEGFLDKFEPKKTTDDCYTPPAVYEAVKNWVLKEYAVDPSAPIIRPFVPGGDFEKCEYPEGCAVIDNPPFSILSHIVGFYNMHAIPYFLFAPSLNCLNTKTMNVTIIATQADIVYENGAKVPTSFVTNMAPKEVAIDTPPDLYEAINRANKQCAKKKRAKYLFPRNVITIPRLQNLAQNGRRLTIMRNECFFVRNIEALEKRGKAIYGGGLMLSTAAAERAAAERESARLELSSAEMAAVEWLDKQETKQ